MRALLAAIACVACGGPTATPDAPSTFTFTAAYTLDSTITSAVVGSASYASGQTIHFELSFPSYAAAQGSATTMTLVAGSDAGSLTIAPACPYPCGDAFTAVSFDATLSWYGQPIVTVESGFCSMPGGSGCGFAD